MVIIYLLDVNFVIAAVICYKFMLILVSSMMSNVVFGI